MITNTLKMYFIHGTIERHYDTFVIGLLYGEFKAATRNLALVLQDIPNHINYFYGEMFLHDIVRSILPGFLLDRSYVTSTVWFNERYFLRFFESGGGAGFSLVGAGYINFGIIGVVLLFWLIGYVSNVFYSKARTSGVSLVVYASWMSIICSTVRYDVAGPVSQLLKHVLLVVMILYAIHRIAKVASR